ncbi:MAG: hypothetical protein IKF64_00525 [Eubacterium sp.]|nr:hypothetical protein [Eubacterium sp.]
MKRIISLILTIAVISTFSACSGSERLKNMTVVQGVGIDGTDSGVVVTLQYLDLNKGNGKNDGLSTNITSVITGEGDTIAEALKNAEKKLADSLFFGQNKIIAVSDEFEEKHQDAFKRSLVSDKRSRPDVLIFKTHGSAGDVIKSAHKSTRVPADSIYKQLKKNKKAVTVSEYLAGAGLYYYRQ